MPVEDLLYGRFSLWPECLVEQASGGTLNQAPTGECDVQCDAECNDCVQPSQARDYNHDETCEYSYRRPDVGQQVFRVGLQRDRPVELRSFQHPTSGTEIDCGCYAG